MKTHNGMRPQDVVVLLKIAILDSSNWMNKDLAADLMISPAEIGHSLNRSCIAGLIDQGKRVVMKQSLLEFIHYGLPYTFPAQIGPVEVGMPTAHSAPVMSNVVIHAEKFVWPGPIKLVKGHQILPLYKAVPIVASKDKKMYDLLALIDVMRIGRIREKEKAILLLEKMIG